MELEIENNIFKFNFDISQNIILFGKNTDYKTYIFNYLINSLKRKNKDKINGLKVNNTDYEILVIDEETDFFSEFKFTKNNQLKSLIYDDIINSVNDTKMLNYTNEIFDVIDNKVNKMLDRKFNNKIEDNLSFQIEIPDINSIIDKFTNIYINDVILTDANISKAMKRKFLYQLYFEKIKQLKKENKEIFVFISNFDSYLITDEIITILHNINNLSNNTCHFILSSCQNIYEYLNIERFNVYKIINNSIISYDSIIEGIEKGINEYESPDVDNDNLVTEDDINSILNEFINNSPHNIGKILNCQKIKLVKQHPKNINEEYIICNNKLHEKIYKNLFDIFIDNDEEI